MAKIYLTTPFLEVKWSALNKPAKPLDEGKEPKYSIRFNVDDDTIKAHVAAVKKLVGDVKFPKTKVPAWGIAKSEEGVITILATSKYKPAIFDMKNNKLEDPKVGNGTIARAACELYIHEKGVSLTVNSIQIKKLVEYEGQSGKSPFDTGEGYEAEGGSPFSTSDEAEGDSDNGGSALDI